MTLQGDDQQTSFIRSLSLFTQQHRAGHWSGPFSAFMQEILALAPDRVARIPLRLLEHARFKLAEGRLSSGAGQGDGQPGDVLRQADPDDSGQGDDSGAGGNGQGEVKLMLEFSIDEVMDWLWDELRLPDLQPRANTRVDTPERVREGWDKRGAPSRLDRRRTAKQAIKRRAVQPDPVPFTNEDLRFRQIVARQRPSTSAAVFFVIDVSASMTQLERKLAKSFFFFALQGIRRKYAKVQTRFIAHTTRAWEFSEAEFFQVSGSGGTIASSAFRLTPELVRTELDAAHENIYLFYASDGENCSEDRAAASHALAELELFTRFMAMAGSHILEQSAARANRLERAMAAHGQQRVEAVLDAALALETHIDVNQPLHRDRFPEFAAAPAEAPANLFRDCFAHLPGELDAPTVNAPPRRAPLLPQPESDLLWFLAQYAPDLEDWERDIFLAVREEAFYFHPIHTCQIMNEGWASYWHARLLREASFLPPELYLAAIKSHSDVVRPYAGGQQLALSLNPYHLGFSMWEHIIEKHGIDKAREICREEDDFGFIRNYLDRELAQQHDLFVYETRKDGETKVATRDIHAIREAILAPKFNFGAPSVSVLKVGADGSLELRHDYLHDGRGLDLTQAERVMEYVARVWRRPVSLHTVDYRGVVRVLPARKTTP